MSLWSATVTLFLLIDPFGNIPVFHALLEKCPPRERHRILLRELIVALIILLVFLFAGRAILHVLGLKPPALSIAGGVILFLIALRMVFPEYGKAPEPEDEHPFIVPMAVPLIAGPSCVAMLLLMASTAPDRLMEWTIALVIGWGVAAAVILSSSWLLSLLRPRGLRAMVRLMGMLLIMVGVQMLLDGIASYVKSV